MKRLSWVFLLLPVLFTACNGDRKGQPGKPSGQGATEEMKPLPGGVHQQTITLSTGGTLRYTISIPQWGDATKPAPLVVVLHYGGEVTPFYGREMIDDLVGPALRSLNAIIIAPDAMSGDWTSAKNEAAVVWLTQTVMKTYGTDPKKVLLTGFSMGGKGTWHIGSKHQDLFTAAIPIAGEPTGTADWKIPVYVIHSTKDEVIPIAPARKHAEKLKTQGAKVTFKELTTLTHFQVPEYGAPLKDALPWIESVWK
jgi:predicted peptidase